MRNPHYDSEYVNPPAYYTNKKELVSEFNGMIEGSYGATPYHFGGYEGCVRLYRTPIVGRNANYRYEIEATLCPLANDYMICARPEYKIWGQHPCLKDNDRIVFKQDDRGMNAEEWFEAFKYNQGHNDFEKMPLLDLLHMFWVLCYDWRVIDNWFLYERVLYLLKGDITMLDNPIVVISPEPWRDVAFGSFEYKELQRAIITHQPWDSKELKLYFGGENIATYNEIPGMQLTESWEEHIKKFFKETVLKTKRLEIPYPHL